MKVAVCLLAGLFVTTILLTVYSAFNCTQEFSPRVSLHTNESVFQNNKDFFSRNSTWIPERISPLLRNTTAFLSNFVQSLFVQKKAYFVVFVIPSLATDASQRRAIRGTWTNYTRWSNVSGVRDPRFKVMFILGRIGDSDPSEELQQEIDEYEDTYYVGDLVEHRHILKYKVLWGMQMALSSFSFSYLVKTDCDIEVNLPRLLEDLYSQPRDRYYSGSCGMGYGGKKRGLPGWGYCSGGGYVLSTDVVQNFNRLPEKVYQVTFSPEDAFTGWLVYNLRKELDYQVYPKNRRGLGMQRHGYECGIRNNAWFYHRNKSPESHHETFHKLNAGNHTTCLE